MAETTISKFVEKYWKTDAGEPIILTAKQKIILEVAMSKNVIVQSSRQQGKTTLIEMLAFINANFFKNQKVVIVTFNQQMANLISEQILRGRSQLPNESACPLLRHSKNILQFVNGSEIQFLVNPNEDSFRGMSVDLMLFDELAYAKLSSKVMETASFCTVNTNPHARTFIASTRKSRSKNNVFWKMWLDTVEGKTRFIPYTMSFTENPRFTEDKIKQLKNAYGRGTFYREYYLKNKPIKELAYEELLEIIKNQGKGK
jgi:hypothetical protein